MLYLSISAYKFIKLNKLAQLSTQLSQRCQSLNLKGTILLSQEGINIALAGTPSQVSAFSTYCKQDVRFSDLVFKKSWSNVRPFRRFRVKVKEEIIKIGMPFVWSGQYTVPHLAPATLKQWLDQGKDFTLLDTRNDYEVKLGSFKGAVSLDIAQFSQLPPVAYKQLSRFKHKPMVMFCTGGIRCEKAGPLLKQQGVSEVYQLDGGILNYFEQYNGVHWQGECFVFDNRVAIDSNLQVSTKGYCPNCVEPLPQCYRHLPCYERVKLCQHCVTSQKIN